MGRNLARVCALPLVAVACCALLLPSSSRGLPRINLFGRSVAGRALVVVERGDPHSARRLLVVGCIHGNECAGIEIARQLTQLRPPPGVAVWIIENLNPDGYAAGTRGNARGVDLNRNFPWRWRRLRGSEDSGPRPLSEPESRFVYALVLRVRPTVSIWFHQHMGVVDESGGNAIIERRFATLTGLPLARLPRFPGSVASWENHRFPRSTAFVVELPAGTLTRKAALRFARAAVRVT